MKKNTCSCGRSFRNPIGLGIHYRSCRKCPDCEGSGVTRVLDDDGDVIGDVPCKWCQGTGKASAKGMSITKIEREIGIVEEQQPTCDHPPTRARVEAEIVVWLRSGCGRKDLRFTFDDLADAIERGEHRAKK